jgi:hypothetical protein
MLLSGGELKSPATTTESAPAVLNRRATADANSRDFEFAADTGRPFSRH